MPIPDTLRKVLAGWSVLSVAVLGLLLPHESVPATILGRYSPSYAALLAVAAGLTLLSVVGAALMWSGRLATLQWVRDRLSPRLAWVLALGLLMVAAVWWIVSPGALHVYPFNLFRVYIALWLVGAGALAVVVSSTGAQPVADRWLGVGLLIGLLVGAGLTFSFIDRIPPSLIYDEPILSDYALSCASGAPSISTHPLHNELTHGLLTLPAILCLHGQVMRWFPATLEMLRMVGVGLVWMGVPLVFGLLRAQLGMAAATAGALVMGLFPADARLSAARDVCGAVSGAGAVCVHYCTADGALGLGCGGRLGAGAGA